MAHKHTEDKEAPAKAPRRRSSLFALPLGKSLEPFLKPVYKKHGFAEHRILSEWTAIVGAQMAAYSSPQRLSFSRGQDAAATLYISATDSCAFQMKYQQPEIIDRINTYFGYPAVKMLKFLPLNTTQAGSNTPQKPTPAKTPDPSYAALAATCDDEALREALLSLSKALTAVEN